MLKAAHLLAHLVHFRFQLRELQSLGFIIDPRLFVLVFQLSNVINGWRDISRNGREKFRAMSLTA